MGVGIRPIEHNRLPVFLYSGELFYHLIERHWTEISMGSNLASCH